MARCLGLCLLLSGCAWMQRLPHEQSYPSLGGYIAGGATLDAGLQVAKLHPVLRVVTVATVGGVVRYSRCCHRPEAAHFGLGYGAMVSEIVGLAIRGRP